MDQLGFVKSYLVIQKKYTKVSFKYHNIYKFDSEMSW